MDFHAFEEITDEEETALNFFRIVQSESTGGINSYYYGVKHRRPMGRCELRNTKGEAVFLKNFAEKHNQ